ncbi:MAG: GYD domain-containing protein [Halobacteriota archaeon]
MRLRVLFYNARAQSTQFALTLLAEYAYSTAFQQSGAGYSRHCCGMRCIQQKGVTITTPMYITLMKWTQAGIENIKELPQRAEYARNIFKSVGGELKTFYMTFGRYDTIGIVEAPRDEAMGKALLVIGSKGAVSIETLKAVLEEEGSQIIKGLP